MSGVTLKMGLVVFTYCNEQLLIIENLAPKEDIQQIRRFVVKIQFELLTVIKSRSDDRHGGNVHLRIAETHPSLPNQSKEKK